MSSPPFFLRDSRASETRACVKITHARKGDTWLFSHGLIFMRAHVLLALLSLRKNGGLLVFYYLGVQSLTLFTFRQT